MGLHDALDRLFEDWRGSGADAGRDYAGSVHTFMSHELQVMGGLVDAITAYCSMIVAAPGQALFFDGQGSGRVEAAGRGGGHPGERDERDGGEQGEQAHGFPPRRG
jgi:hypothetical protein